LAGPAAHRAHAAYGMPILCTGSAPKADLPADLGALFVPLP
jgi:hypothetical protein